MLAQRADDILGELVALVDVAANLADKAFLAFGLGLRLDVLLIVVVGHGLPVADDAASVTLQMNMPWVPRSTYCSTFRDINALIY